MVALFASACNFPCSCPFSVSLHPAQRALNSEPPPVEAFGFGLFRAFFGKNYVLPKGSLRRELSPQATEGVRQRLHYLNLKNLDNLYKN